MRELKFDLNIDANALLAPNPTEFYSRAYISDDVQGNFRLVPGVKYKTKLARTEFDRVLYASKCKFEDIADNNLDAMDIDVCAVSALAEICQFDAEQAFFSSAIAPGSNHANFTPQMFMAHYWEALSEKIQEEVALIRWQGDTDLPTSGATGFLGECDGLEKKIDAATGVTEITGATNITNSNVIAEMSRVYNGLPNALKHKTRDLRFYVSANVGAAYLEAVAQNNTILYTTMNPELTWLGRIKIVVQEGMSDDTMVLTRHQNLIYAFDAIGDGDNLKAVNLTETVAEPTLRTRANLKIGFYIAEGLEHEIVFYQA